MSATTKPSPEILRLQRGPIFSTLIRLSLSIVLAMVGLANLDEAGAGSNFSFGAYRLVIASKWPLSGSEF